MHKKESQELMKQQIKEIAARQANQYWLAQLAFPASKIPFKNQSERCTSNVLKANFNTVGSQHYTNEFLEKFLTEIKSILANTDSNLITRKQSALNRLLKGIAKKVVVNPTSKTFASATLISSIATGKDIFDTENPKSNLYGDIPQSIDAAKKDLVLAVAPDNACVSMDAAEHLILDAIKSDPIEFLKDVAKNASNTSETFGSIGIGALSSQAIKISAVLINTFATNKAAQEIFTDAQKAFDFSDDDKDLMTIKRIVDDTRYLRAIFVRDWQINPAPGTSNSSKERSLYREAAIYELMCVVGKDARIRKLSPNRKDHLPHSLIERLEQCIAVALYGKNAHRVPNQKDLFLRLRNHCNNAWLKDELAERHINAQLTNSATKLAPDNIKREAMYAQLYAVRDLMEKEMTWAAEKTQQNSQDEEISENSPAP